MTNLRAAAGRAWPRSLYARIAIVYLILLLVLCAICVWITVSNGSRYVAEMEQRFNLMLAGYIAHELAEPVRHDVDGAAVRRVAERINALNPTVDIYVLDRRGRILAAYGCPEPRTQRVRMAPIHGLQARATLPIRGDDPCKPAEPKVFSAAPMQLAGGASGYLYAVLTSPLETSAASRARGSYLLRTLSLTVVLALSITAVLGLILFAWLTRRFHKLTASVRQFESGEHTRRADERSRDEIGDLARAFNGMAATIEAQVEALKRTDEARRNLVANVSHDFRTPLTSLRGYVERLLMRGDNLTVVERREHLQAVLDNARQLQGLADALSSLSQLEAHDAAPRFEWFSLAELVQDVLLKFEPAAKRAGVRLHAEHDPKLPRVEADIGLLERAVSNLVDNAMRACERGGTVCVSLSATDHGVTLTVSDDGAGIPAAELAMVTRRFYRTERSRLGSDSGSGLGLAIAREIVELHGATLALRSAVGEGTAVSFGLPAAR